MKKSLYLLTLVFVVLAFAFSACTRSASRAAVPTATDTGDLPFPVPATQNPLQVILTQTAVAKGGGAPAVPTAPPAAGEQPTQEAVILPTNTLAPPIELPSPEPVVPTATPAPVVVATFVPTPGLPGTYTLQEGEYPFCIARRFNLDPSELLSINGLTDTSQPPAGTVLTIPTTGNPWPVGDRALRPHPTTHTADSNDTVYSIACFYGDVDPNAIITVNGLQSPYTLTTGQTLQIP